VHTCRHRHKHTCHNHTSHRITQTLANTLTRALTHSSTRRDRWISSIIKIVHTCRHRHKHTCHNHTSHRITQTLANTLTRALTHSSTRRDRCVDRRRLPLKVCNVPHTRVHSLARVLVSLRYHFHRLSPRPRGRYQLFCLRMHCKHVIGTHDAHSLLAFTFGHGGKSSVNARVPCPASFAFAFFLGLDMHSPGLVQTIRPTLIFDSVLISCSH
jgi:hypothetical protein